MSAVATLPCEIQKVTYDNITNTYFALSRQNNAPAHRARDTVELLRCETPQFISPCQDMYPASSPGLNLVDYRICGMTQESVYKVPSGLVAWHSGRTSVFGRRTFPVLRSTCCKRVTTYVGKAFAIGQPTRPT